MRRVVTGQGRCHALVVDLLEDRFLDDGRGMWRGLAVRQGSRAQARLGLPVLRLRVEVVDLGLQPGDLRVEDAGARANGVGLFFEQAHADVG